MVKPWLWVPILITVTWVAPVAPAEPTTPTLRQPLFVSAADWGSEPDPIPAERAQTPRRLTIHHAGELWKETDDPIRKLRGLQGFGKREKGWPDLPYHFLIAPDGRVFEGRPLGYQPESNTKYELDGHVGIMLWGNFEEQRVSLPALESVVWLSAKLCREQGIDPATLSTHRDVAPGQTVCPGKDLYRYVENGSLKGWIMEATEGGSPKVALLPPAEDGPVPMIAGGETAYR